MKCKVVSIAAYAGSDAIAAAIIRSDAIRHETLNRCYRKKGYKKLPLAERNKIYDAVRAKVEAEMGVF